MIPTVHFETRLLPGTNDLSSREFLREFLSFSSQGVSQRRVTGSSDPGAAIPLSAAWVDLLGLLRTGSGTARPWEVSPGPGNAPRLAAEREAEPSRLKVLTYNVWGLPAWISGASPARHARIAEELEQLGSDMVLLEEVWTSGGRGQAYPPPSGREGYPCERRPASTRRRRSKFGAGTLQLSRIRARAAESGP